MAFWDLHAAWFYRQLALIGEWQSGYQDYAQFATQAEATKHIRVPVQSFYVAAGYLLTGETRSQRRRRQAAPSVHAPQGRVRARVHGKSSARYDYMDIGSSVYDYGLASTTGNANRLWHDRHRHQLAHDPVPQDGLRLEPRRVQQSRHLCPRQVQLDQQHALVAVPALLLMSDDFDPEANPCRPAASWS